MEYNQMMRAVVGVFGFMVTDEIAFIDLGSVR